MRSDITQANYEQLDEIAQRFTTQSQHIVQMQALLRQRLAALQQGGWEGRGADAFFSEMEGELLPATTRLQDALQEASAVTRQISAILRQAEEEAAALFASDGASDGAPGAATDAAPTASSSGVSVVTDPAQIFNPDYMRNFIGRDFQGSNSPELNSLMEELVRRGGERSPQVDQLLDRIADIRGVDRAQFRADYESYLQLREAAYQKGGDYPYIDINKHGDFLGTTVSLRYGALVGETFGIDPVFGSLLNPTGGLVGPGDSSYQPSATDAIGYHGTFHDAAGYLYNYHGVGPGYDYLDREPISRASPLAGQASGIAWWVGQSDLEVDILPNIMPDIPGLSPAWERTVGELVEGPVVATARIGVTGYNGGSQIVDGIGDIFSGDFGGGFDEIGGGFSTIGRGLRRSVIDLFD